MLFVKIGKICSSRKPILDIEGRERNGDYKKIRDANGSFWKKSSCKNYSNYMESVSRANDNEKEEKA